MTIKVTRLPARQAQERAGRRVGRAEQVARARMSVPGPRRGVRAPTALVHAPSQRHPRTLRALTAHPKRIPSASQARPKRDPSATQALPCKNDHGLGAEHRPMDSVLYGTKYGALCATDLVLFSWHGCRPVCWKRRFLVHRLSGPIICHSIVPTERDMLALREAMRRHPDQAWRLSLTSKYSVWYGTYFYNVVKC